MQLHDSLDCGYQALRTCQTCIAALLNTRF